MTVGVSSESYSHMFVKHVFWACYIPTITFDNCNFKNRKKEILNNNIFHEGIVFGGCPLNKRSQQFLLNLGQLKEDSKYRYLGDIFQVSA